MSPWCGCRRKGQSQPDVPLQQRTFECYVWLACMVANQSQMDLYDFLNHDSMGGGEADPRYPNRRGSSVWGWVGPKGRQIGLIGQHTGTAFVEIDKKGKLTYLGRLPAQDPLGSSWREIRVLNNYAIIGSEAVGHNVQIFDLNKVAAIDPKKPKTFNKETDLTGLFDDLPIGRAHNVSRRDVVKVVQQ